MRSVNYYCKSINKITLIRLDGVGGDRGGHSLLILSEFIALSRSRNPFEWQIRFRGHIIFIFYCSYSIFHSKSTHVPHNSAPVDKHMVHMREKKINIINDGK